MLPKDRFVFIILNDEQQLAICSGKKEVLNLLKINTTLYNVTHRKI